MRDEGRNGSEIEVAEAIDAGAPGAAAPDAPPSRPRGDSLGAVREAIAEWQERMLDQRSAAGMLGITPTMLRRWLLAGRGPRPFRDGEGPGARVRFDVREIRAFLADPAAYEAAKRGA